MLLIWKKRFFCMVIALGAGLLVTGAVQREKQVEIKWTETQRALADEVLRFHVLANSDSEADQELKLKVRDAVLSYMKRSLSEDADKAETKRWAEGHLKELEELAESTMRTQGYGYQAKAQVKEIYFPEKRYGDITFPKGNYEALRITLGKGEGQNWWCVLYPNLCFLDSVYAVVPKEGKEELEGALTEEEYEMVTVGTKFKIKWFFFGG